MFQVEPSLYVKRGLDSVEKMFKGVVRLAIKVKDLDISPSMNDADREALEWKIKKSEKRGLGEVQ